jgi:hypothetical protein
MASRFTKSILQRAARSQSAKASGAVLGAAAALTAAAAFDRPVSCHGGHDPNAEARIQRLEAQVAALAGKLEGQFDVQETTGQGKAVFSWDQGLTNAFPVDARHCEKDLHGGFNEDVDTGVVYTGIPGYGLCTISPDLKTWTKVGTDERLLSNCHGIVVFKHKGQTLLAIAQNEASRVLVVTTDGVVQQELVCPKGGEFDFGEANFYYSHKPVNNVPWGNPHRAAFAVTDVTFLDGKLYVVTGYCDGDYVLVASEKDGKWEWGPTAWGGKGDGPGKFNTAHGVFAYDGHIFVANREAHQVLEYTPTGQLIRALPDIPDGARICNVARAGKDGYFVMNALEPIQHTPAKTAAIYAHCGERLLSTIEPGDLGIPVLKHLHHVWPHYTPEGELYLLVSGWSQGKFAVLKHEPEGKPSRVNNFNRTTEPIKDI